MFCVLLSLVLCFVSINVFGSVFIIVCIFSNIDPFGSENSTRIHPLFTPGNIYTATVFRFFCNFCSLIYCKFCFQNSSPISTFRRLSVVHIGHIHGHLGQYIVLQHRAQSGAHSAQRWPLGDNHLVTIYWTTTRPLQQLKISAVIHASLIPFYVDTFEHFDFLAHDDDDVKCRIRTVYCCLVSCQITHIWRICGLFIHINITV